MTHPNIPAEISGVELESNYESVVDAVEPAPVPSAATRAAATRANSNIGGTPGVAPAKIPGVDDVTDDAESSDDEDGGRDGDSKSPMGLPKLVKSEREDDSSDSEGDSDDEDFSDNDANPGTDTGTETDAPLEDAGVGDENSRSGEDAQAGTSSGSPRRLGRGMRSRKATTSFIPSMKGKKYATGAKYNQLSVNQLGAVHLAYRGQRYLLKDGVVNVNLAGMPGVPEDWEPPTQYADGVINLNTIDAKFAPKSDFDVDEHILGVIMAQQYSLRKGIELFGKRAEVAAVDELSQIHHMATYTPMDHTKLTPE